MTESIFKKIGNNESHTFLVYSKYTGDTVSITLVDDFIVIQSKDIDEKDASYSITLYAPEGWGYLLHYASFEGVIHKSSIVSCRLLNCGTKEINDDIMQDLISMLKLVGHYLPH